MICVEADQAILEKKKKNVGASMMHGLCAWAQRYHQQRAILDQFHDDLAQKLTQGQLRLAWFMQDGARPHTAHASLKHLRFFSRIAWSASTQIMSGAPHSSDLIPLDF